jgi:glycosyltransferase involved in cell wall biosynthesis
VNPVLSIVVPVYNEEEVLPRLVERLEEVLVTMDVSSEIILVNDGSRDTSAVIIEDLAKNFPRLRTLHFRRNFGQTAALDAGFKNARGSYIVAIDADLQNDPRDIPRLFAKAQEGYDVVKGWRRKRKDNFLTRKIPSWIANRIISWFTGVKLKDYGCTLTLYRAHVLKEINLYGEMHRFIPVYADSVGAKMTEIAVDHHARTLGSSKYNITRTFRVLLDLMTVRFILAYNTKPLYFFGKFSFAALFLATASWTWTLIKRFDTGKPLYTDPFFLMGGILAVVGVQLLLMGLLAELTTRTYFESQGKNSWILKDMKSGHRADLPDSSEE